MGIRRDYREEEKIDPEERDVWALLEMIRIFHQSEQEPGKVTAERKNQFTVPEECKKMNREKKNRSEQAGWFSEGALRAFPEQTY